MCSPHAHSHPPLRLTHMLAFTLTPTLIHMRDVEGFIAVSLGSEHSLALKHDGTLWGAGQNTAGQLGLRSKKPQRFPNFVQILLGNAKTISCGGAHNMVLKQDGSVWSAGRNTCGQIGDGTKATRLAFVQVIPINQPTNRTLFNQIYIQNSHTNKQTIKY